MSALKIILCTNIKVTAAAITTQTYKRTHTRTHTNTNSCNTSQRYYLSLREGHSKSTSSLITSCVWLQTAVITITQISHMHPQTKHSKFEPNFMLDDQFPHISFSKISKWTQTFLSLEWMNAGLWVASGNGCHMNWAWIEPSACPLRVHTRVPLTLVWSLPEPGHILPGSLWEFLPSVKSLSPKYDPVEVYFPAVHPDTAFVGLEIPNCSTTDQVILD